MLTKASPAIDVNEVTKTFGNRNLPIMKRMARLNGKGTGKLSTDWVQQFVIAVDHVSFKVCEGEIFGLVGAGGSGKSVLIRLIATLLQPDGGELRVFGYDSVRQAMQVQRLINPFSFDASFFKQASPLENLLFGARLSGMGGAEARSWIIELLSHLGLELQAIETPMEELSRSLQQLVAIARGLLARPRLLLLDEPFSELDSNTKCRVRQVIRQMRDEQGITVLLATRDLPEAESLCDRIALFESGKIVAEGIPGEHEWITFLPQQVPSESISVDLSCDQLVEELA